MLSSIRFRRQISSPILLSHLESLFPSFNHTLNGTISCPNPKFLCTTPNTSIEFNETAVSETLSSYNNDWQKAMDFFNWVETDCKFQHTTDTYNRMIDILGKFFEFDLSWELIQRMKDNALCYPNHATFRVMFKRYACAHLVNEAVSLYDHRLGEFDLKDQMSFTNLIDALCEHKHVVEAEELCLAMTSSMKSTKVYNMLLRGWFIMGWLGKCREFWEEMDKIGVYKDLHSYSIYMDIMCKTGKPYKAVKLYKEMKQKKINMDVVAYNTVIRAIGLSKGVDFATSILREMIELGCAPNIVTFNIVIKLLCDNGRLKEAYALINQMTRMGCPPDVTTYQRIFRCLEKPQEILELFDRMIENGVRPRMDTYVMLMRKFGRWGFLRPVFILWEKIEEHGCSPDESAYAALIDVLVQKNEIERARKYDDEMLAKGISGKSRVEHALALLNREPRERYNER